MSQAQAQPAAAAVATPPQPAPAAVAPSGPPATQTAPAPPAAAGLNTPSRLRLLGTGVVVLGVITGLFGALVLSALAYSLARAEADTDQLVRVQQIQTNLLIADATATNAFLVGGLEPAAQRAQYDEALTRTGTLIAEAARYQPADADVLATLNQQVLAYAGSIEQARANNRQGLPIGAQYLRAASAQLRSESLPILSSLVSTNASRAESRMELWIGVAYLIVATLALGALIVAQVWLANRFRRRINRGLLAASILLLAALVAATFALVQLSGTVGSIKVGSFASVNAAADARIEASNAKSNESLTLIARGSGTAFEKAWLASADRVTGDLVQLGGAAPTAEWDQYRTKHAEIRKLDDGGNWDGAVALATGSGEDSANTIFGNFDARLAETLDSSAQNAAGELSAQVPGLVIGAVLALLAGLGVALLGRRGVDARLREYR